MSQEKPTPSNMSPEANQQSSIEIVKRHSHNTTRIGMVITSLEYQPGDPGSEEYNLIKASFARLLLQKEEDPILQAGYALLETENQQTVDTMSGVKPTGMTERIRLVAKLIVAATNPNEPFDFYETIQLIENTSDNKYIFPGSSWGVIIMKAKSNVRKAFQQMYDYPTKDSLNRSIADIEKTLQLPSVTGKFREKHVQDLMKLYAIEEVFNLQEAISIADGKENHPDDFAKLVDTFLDKKYQEAQQESVALSVQEEEEKKQKVFRFTPEEAFLFSGVLKLHRDGVMAFANKDFNRSFTVDGDLLNGINVIQGHKVFKNTPSKNTIFEGRANALKKLALYLKSPDGAPLNYQNLGNAEQTQALQNILSGLYEHYHQMPELLIAFLDASLIEIRGQAERRTGFADPEKTITQKVFRVPLAMEDQYADALQASIAHKGSLPTMESVFNLRFDEDSE
jgi:hypothetical protein